MGAHAALAPSTPRQYCKHKSMSALKVGESLTGSSDYRTRQKDSASSLIKLGFFVELVPADPKLELTKRLFSALPAVHLVSITDLIAFPKTIRIYILLTLKRWKNSFLRSLSLCSNNGRASMWRTSRTFNFQFSCHVRPNDSCLNSTSTQFRVLRMKGRARSRHSSSS